MLAHQRSLILPLKAFLVNTHPPITKYVKGEKLEFSKVKFNPKIGVGIV